MDNTKILASYYGGSRLYQLNNENSDYDVRNIFMDTSPSYILGMSNNDAKVVNNREEDIVSYEVRYFFKLLNKGAINVVESLFCDEGVFNILTDEFKEIRENRGFLLSSDNFFSAVSGFVHNQVRLGLDEKNNTQEGSKRNELIKEYGFNGKPLIHALRVLESATNYFETGIYNVVPTKNYELCLNIKNDPSYYSCDYLKNEIQTQFDKFYETKNFSAINHVFHRSTADGLLLKFYRPYLF